MPSESRLRDASVRLEVLNALYERELLTSNTSWIYINPDSSPQLGWDWLVMWEEVFGFKLDYFYSPEQYVIADLNRHFKANINMLSTLGRGR